MSVVIYTIDFAVLLSKDVCRAEGEVTGEVLLPDDATGVAVCSGSGADVVLETVVPEIGALQEAEANSNPAIRNTESSFFMSFPPMHIEFDIRIQA